MTFCSDNNLNEVPLVSVVVPSYNSSDFIVETVESILKQKLKKIEILIVDDCSTDDTLEKIRTVKSDILTTISLEKNHGGPSRPRGEGVRRARAKYIAFCDSDDLLLPNALMDAVMFLETIPAVAMVISDAKKFNENSIFEKHTFLTKYNNFKSLKKEKLDDSRYVIEPDIAYHGLFFENYILNPGCVVVRREVFSGIGSFDETLKNADDWDMWLRIARVYPIGFIDKVALHYRVRSGSVSARGAVNSENRIKVLRKHLNQELPAGVRRQIRTLISRNYLSAGYASQVGGNMATARGYYQASLKERWSLRGVKGVFLTFLHPRLYSALKRTFSAVDVPRRGL